MAKKTIRKTPPPATARPEPDAAAVMAKIMAGLTRPQALEVLAQQAAHDLSLNTEH